MSQPPNENQHTIKRNNQRRHASHDVHDTTTQITTGPETTTVTKVDDNRDRPRPLGPEPIEGPPTTYVSNGTRVTTVPADIPATTPPTTHHIGQHAGTITVIESHTPVDHVAQVAYPFTTETTYTTDIDVTTRTTTVDTDSDRPDAHDHPTT